MACLASAAYDPAVRVQKSTAALLAMTAIDTTNLRLTFTAPANGKVLVRLFGIVRGAATYPQILLGILDGATVKARQAPMGTAISSSSAERAPQEAVFVIGGLTPGNSYTWDAAYGVETLIAATNIEYGGPDNATATDAAGAFLFEIWETTNLLGAVLYDPAVAVSKSTAALLAMTAFDTTNARITFTAPASGRVFWRIQVVNEGGTTHSQCNLGVMEGATVRARVAQSVGNPGTNLATTHYTHVASGVINGLTPGNSYSFDAAYGVETVGTTTGFKYGGPDDATTADNAFGGLAFEIWAA